MMDHVEHDRHAVVIINATISRPDLANGTIGLGEVNRISGAGHSEGRETFAV